MNDRFEQSRRHLIQVATDALAAGFGGASSVPPELARVVALGTGKRPEVEEALRRGNWPHGHPLEMVRFDADQIGDFVFESVLPPVIAGASSLLHDLNAGIEEEFGSQVVFSGGGEGLLIASAGKGEELCGKIEQRFAEATAGALTVTTAWIPASPLEFVTDSRSETAPKEGARWVSGTQAVLARLHDAIRRKKEERRDITPTIDGNATRCLSCRDRAGSRDVKLHRPDARGLLCEPCDTRWQEGKKRIYGANFDQMVGAFAAAVGESGVEGSKARDLGFLYADGNGMGALFGRLESLTEVRFVSGAVRRVFVGVEARVRRLVEKAVRFAHGDPLPWVSLLAGGDEGVWILPAALALEVASLLPAWVDEESASIVGLGETLIQRGVSRLSVGMGLVLCPHHFPVRYQYDVAKALQKSAKKLFYSDPKESPVSVLDFEVLTDSSPLSDDLTTARREAYRTEEDGFLRTTRPFHEGEVARLRRSLARATKARVAKSQFYALQESALEGRSVFRNTVLYQLGRSGTVGDRFRKWLQCEDVVISSADSVEKFLVSQEADRQDSFGTWISEAIELWPYLDLTAQREAPHAAS